MKATQTELSAKDKIPLYRHIPLETPLSLTIEPSGLCNLKCNYCLHSLPEPAIEAKRHTRQLMTDDIFERIITDLSLFPKPVKSITFARLGEPLLNKKLPGMVDRLKSNNLCEKTLVITNGIPLTHQMSLDLVESGLDRIKISICGLSSADYYMNCGVEVDFDRLVSEIGFLYGNKGEMKIQIKILDKLLGKDADNGKDRFYTIFEGICDEIDIECLYPMFGNDINYHDLYFKDSTPPVNRYNSVEKRKICPMPFFKMLIAADGRVDYCFSGGIFAGYLSESNLYDIWFGEKRNTILLNLLYCKHEGVTEPCLSCGCFQDTVAEEDNLDHYADSLIERINLSRGIKTDAQ